MAGTKLGGLKAHKTNLERHGKDYYARIGHLGGTTPSNKPKGFAAMPTEKVQAAGRKGGKISKRGKTKNPRAQSFDHGIRGIERPRKEVNEQTN